MTRLPGFGFILTMLLALIAARDAAATQHLVSPGDRWELIAKKAAPGDEVVLMPGKHRAVNLYGLCGEPDKPIVVRGVNEDNPAIIVAERYGMRLHRTQYVRFENITITDATLCGLVIDDAPADNQMTIVSLPAEPDESAERDDLDDTATFLSRSLEFNNVRILKTGPEGNRNALQLLGVINVRFNGCEIEGWAGASAIIAGCRDVRFDDCRFIGLPDHSQKSIAQIGGATETVFFENCRFEHGLKQGIVIGALMEDDTFRPALRERERRIFAARDVRILQSVFVDCAVPVTFGDVDGASVFSNTFVRPRQYVFDAQRQADDDRFAPMKEIRFGANLIVWEPGDLTQLCRVVGEHKRRTFDIGSNLWWSSESEEDRAALGELPGIRQMPQITDVDPQLGEDLRPTVVTSGVFGHQDS